MASNSSIDTRLTSTNFASSFSIQNALIVTGLIAVTIVAFQNYGWHWISVIVYPVLAALLFARVQEILFLVQHEKVFALPKSQNQVGAIWACLRILGVLLVLFGLVIDVEAINNIFDDDVICTSIWDRYVPEVTTLGAFAIGLAMCVMPMAQFDSAKSFVAPASSRTGIKIAVGCLMAVLTLALLLLKANYDAIGFSLIMSISQQIQFGNFNINTDPFSYNNTTDAVMPVYRGALLGILALCFATVGVLVAKSKLKLYRRVGVAIYVVCFSAAIFLLCSTPWQASLSKISPILGEFHVVPMLTPIISIGLMSAVVSIPLGYWLNREATLVQLDAAQNHANLDRNVFVADGNRQVYLMDRTALTRSELSWWISVPLLILLFVESDLISEFVPLEKSDLITTERLQEWFGNHSVIHWFQFNYSLKLLALISCLWLLKGMWNRAQFKAVLSTASTPQDDAIETAATNASTDYQAWLWNALKNRFIFQHVLAVTLLVLSFIWWQASEGSRDSQAQLRALVMLLFAMTIWSWNRNHQVCVTNAMRVSHLAWTAAALAPVLFLSSYFFQWFGASSAWADDGRGSSSILSLIYKLYSLFG